MGNAVSAAASANQVLMTPPLAVAPATFNGSSSLTQALVHAYYQRDIDSIRRIAAQVEQQLAALGQPKEAS